MSIKLKRLLLISFALILLESRQTIAYDSTTNRVTLKGLQGIGVIVRLNDPGKRYDLTENAIQTDIELKLRTAGIKVFDTSPLKVAGEAGLVAYIDMYDRHGESDVLAFSINLSVEQPVVLLRDSSINVIAETWALGLVGTVGKDKAQEVRVNVKDLTDQFINAYLTANPKVDRL